MQVMPIIQTFNNKKGEIIKVLKQEVTVPVVTRDLVKGSVIEKTALKTISKRTRTVVYDKQMNPLRCKEVSIHKGNILQDDVYQKAAGEGVDLKQRKHGVTKIINFLDKSFEEIAANFFK